MNAFFDGYVYSKTSLKQFAEWYERALQSKVEKEFQADFKSYSQFVPCATTFEMEMQFQSVYIISKFKKVQDEFTGKFIVMSFQFQMVILGRRMRFESLLHVPVARRKNIHFLLSERDM